MIEFCSTLMISQSCPLNIKILNGLYISIFIQGDVLINLIKKNLIHLSYKITNNIRHGQIIFDTQKLRNHYGQLFRGDALLI